MTTGQRTRSRNTNPADRPHRGFWAGLALLAIVLWSASRFAMATVPPVARVATVAALEGSAPASAVAHPVRGRLEDEAQVLSKDARRGVEEILSTLGRRASIHVITRVLDDLEEFESASQAAFREVVQATNHYRVVVIFIAYSRDKRHGIISTNLGAGIWTWIGREDCKGLFGDESSPLNSATILDGVGRLADLLRAHVPEGDPEETAVYEGLDRAGRRLPWIVLAILVMGAVGIALRRSRICPECGANLRSRVSIALASSPSGRVARRTSRCFDCGWSHRRSLVPSFLQGILRVH